MAYTYDDFQKAASGSNVNFSQYDLDLAKKYPEFGMSVLDLKKQYAGATTAEQRALINAKANQLRSSYGNYTAGADGSQYVSDGTPAPYRPQGMLESHPENMCGSPCKIR